MDTPAEATAPAALDETDKVDSLTTPPSKDSGETNAAASNSASSAVAKEGGEPSVLKGDAWLKNQTRKVFDGLATLASSELKATMDEFQLLENVNRVAAAKYAEVSDTVDSLETVMKEIIDQHKSLASHIAEIDAVDKSVKDLEDTVVALDTYTAKLAAAANKALEKAPSASRG